LLEAVGLRALAQGADYGVAAREGGARQLEAEATGCAGDEPAGGLGFGKGALGKDAIA
jgi:hypothetical protein